MTPGTTVLRLPWEVNPLFQQWLDAHFPDRAARVMARVRDMRGGKDYDAAFGQRMTGSGLWAQMLRDRFRLAARRLGFNRERRVLDLSQFVRPTRPVHSVPRATATKVAVPEVGHGRSSKAATTPATERGDAMGRQGSLF